MPCYYRMGALIIRSRSQPLQGWAKTLILPWVAPTVIQIQPLQGWAKAFVLPWFSRMVI